MSAPRPAFLIERGVLVVPSWEWDSTRETICGHPYVAYLDRGPRTRLTLRAFGMPPPAPHWATLMFANGWNVNWSWADHPAGDRCTAWLHRNGDPAYRAATMPDTAPDDLLRLIGDVAAREPWAVHAAATSSASSPAHPPG